MTKSNPLTAKFVEAVRTQGVYRDTGNPGLLLRVEPSGSKRWVLRTTVCGRRRDIGLGSARNVSLREARDEAANLRKVARRGDDPIQARRAAKSARLTLEEAAERYHAQHEPIWRNSKHGAQWISSLRRHVFPRIGKMAVGDIHAADVLGVLLPIWHARPETARRIRQRIGVVLDWATTAGYRSSLTVNAAQAVRGGLPRQRREVKHHVAVPWPEIPAFARQIRRVGSAEAVRFALEFTLLTATRTSEALGAQWSEIDMERATWTVPARRMKGNREHRVPLSERAIQILGECRLRWPDSTFVFPGRKPGRPLSNMSMLMAMRRMHRKEVPHGLRSSFRDWAADTGQDRDAAEAALAHVVAGKTEAAYRRTDLLDARRQMMDRWAAFATGERRE